MEAITQTAYNNINKPCVAAELLLTQLSACLLGEAKSGYEVYRLSSFSEVFLDAVSKETAGDTGVKEIFKENCIAWNIFSFFPQ